MENLFNVIGLLLVALSFMSIMCPFIIEIIKNIVGNDWVVKIFTKMEIFSIFITSAVGALVYIFLLLFYVDTMCLLNIAQRIFIFIIWIICCAVCSQNCYDKVIKWIMGLISRGK